MFSYSVKFVCGSQNAAAAGANIPCSPVRQGIYATEVNIHNFQRDKEAVIEKRAILLVHNDSPDGPRAEGGQGACVRQDRSSAG